RFEFAGRRRIRDPKRAICRHRTVQALSLDEHRHRRWCRGLAARPWRFASAYPQRRYPQAAGMNLGAVILAGGESRRMGQDKAWIKVGGESLIARVISIVR